MTELSRRGETGRPHRRPHRRRPARRRPRRRDRRGDQRRAARAQGDLLPRPARPRRRRPACVRKQAGHAHHRAPDGDVARARRCCRSTRATTRPTAGTPTSRSSTASRKHRCCGRFRCPSYGGTTTWASTEAAYDQLPAPLRALAENLWAVHTNTYDYAADYDGRHEQLADTVRAVPRGVRVASTTRPSIRWCGCIPRPASGCCCSAISSNSSSGWARPSRRRCSTCCRPESPSWRTLIRWNWQPGDLAIWDNRATQHYAVADYDDQYRRLNRVTLAGDIPVDVHGRHSRAVVGDASPYSDVVSPIALAS